MARECSLSEREARRYLDRIAPLGLTSETPAVPRLASREAIHDLRVACRRARVFLAEFGDNLPAGAQRKARNLMSKIVRRLGEARELDVSLALLRERVAPDTEQRLASEFTVLRLEMDRFAAQEDVNAVDTILESGKFADIVARLRTGFQPSTACHLRHARGRLRKRFGKVQDFYRTWRDSGLDEDLHLLRIRLKTFRYAIEIYRSIYGKRADRFLEMLASAQEALGRWHDLRCLHARVARAERDAPRELRAAVARLAEAMDADVTVLLANVDVELDAFFSKRAIKKHRELFDDPSRACCRGAR